MRTNICFIFFFAVVFLLSGIASGQSRQDSGQAHNSIRQIDETQLQTIANRDGQNGIMDDYKLGSGDILKIAVYGEDKLTGAYTIDGNGEIDLPLIGSLKARGIGVDALRQRIIAKLAQGYLKDPNVTIDITKFRPFYIMGEIRKPGGYEYVDGITVRNAVAISGGFTYRADRDDIIILRKQGENKRRLEVDADARVMPGDTIKIEERFF